MTYTSHTARYTTALIMSVLMLVTAYRYASAQEIPPEEPSIVEEVPTPVLEEETPEPPATPADETPEALPDVPTPSPEDSASEAVTDVPEETMCVLPPDTETVPLDLPLPEADPEEVQCILPEVVPPSETLDTATSTDSLSETTPVPETVEETPLPTEVPEDPEMYPDHIPFGPDGAHGLGRCVRGNWEVEGFDSMGECVREVRG